ncbi:helix-turn-helix domain-containing protein [Bacillus cereus]|uniref:helix-turn-helix domain-containing protein n=1 Tax=Bacillus cereus TaxID=1396 RepID=UPI0035AC084F
MEFRWLHSLFYSCLLDGDKSKFHVYPNKKQEILIVKTIGCSRFFTFFQETQ